MRSSLVKTIAAPLTFVFTVPSALNSPALLFSKTASFSVMLPSAIKAAPAVFEVLPLRVTPSITVLVMPVKSRTWFSKPDIEPPLRVRTLSLKIP